MAATPDDQDPVRAASEGWLRLLREGTSEQKALARTELGVIFERLGMPEMAIEAYIGNLRRRVRDRRVYERLAALFTRRGDHHSAWRVSRIEQRLFDGYRAPSAAPDPCLLCGDSLDVTCLDCLPLQDNEPAARGFFHCSCSSNGVGPTIPYNGSTRLEDLQRKRAYYQSTGWMDEQRVRELRAKPREPAGSHGRLAGTVVAWLAAGCAALTLLISVGAVTASTFFAPILGALSVFHPQGGLPANLWMAGSISIAGILVLGGGLLIVVLAGKRRSVLWRLWRH